MSKELAKVDGLETLLSGNSLNTPEEPAEGEKKKKKKGFMDKLKETLEETFED